MLFDRHLFADKVRRHCVHFCVSMEELSERTGISIGRLQALDSQTSDPTGDEVLILADFFKCDFDYFISNETRAVFEKTEALFRAHSDKLDASDRWAVQEFLYLCECEHFLLSQPSLASTLYEPFTCKTVGGYYKKHGWDAASELRKHLGYSSKEVPRDVFADFRKIGLHVFRRSMSSRDISGLFIRHPTAGLCVLVNFDEDPLRQRFTAAHEAGHALLDDSLGFGVSFRGKRERDLSEIRANAFASRYLIPPDFLERIPLSSAWDQQLVVEWASTLMVNTQTLLYALEDNGLVDRTDVRRLSRVTVPRDRRRDPELPETLSKAGRLRKEALLKRGLSDFYVGLCIRACEGGLLSQGRLAEMLLTVGSELPVLLSLFGAEGGRRDSHRRRRF